nr:MAG TPA: hypothetical protein [Bacteriophage sp.]
MSGGHFNYSNDNACRDVFGWDVWPDYGDDGFKQSAKARAIDPLEDIVMSELVFDVFCVLHSYDWYKSCDISEETYREDVKRFKGKWLNLTSKDRAKEIVDGELKAVRDKLYRTFEIKEGAM